MQQIPTTPVPNYVFDRYLDKLKFIELKVLLAIIRQTAGYQTKKGNRKTRDWLTRSRIQELTGASRRAITEALDALVSFSLISITNYQGKDCSQTRRGKRLYFSLIKPLELSPRGQTTNLSLSPLEQNTTPTRAEYLPVPGQNLPITKENQTKKIPTKEKNTGTSAIFSPHLWIAEKIATYGSFDDWMVAYRALKKTGDQYDVIHHSNPKLYQERFIPHGFPPLPTHTPYEYWKALHQSFHN